MTKANDLASLLDANGDVVSSALDNVPPSNDASALSTGTLPDGRFPAVLPAVSGANLTNLPVSTPTLTSLGIDNHDQVTVTAGGAVTATSFAGDGSSLTNLPVSTPTLSSLGIDNHDQVTVTAGGNITASGTLNIESREIVPLAKGTEISETGDWNTVTPNAIGYYKGAGLASNRGAFTNNGVYLSLSTRLLDGTHDDTTDERAAQLYFGDTHQTESGGGIYYRVRQGTAGGSPTWHDWARIMSSRSRGTVVQTVHTSTNAHTFTSSQSGFTALEAGLTPLHTSSRILITAALHGSANDDAHAYLEYKIGTGSWIKDTALNGDGTYGAAFGDYSVLRSFSEPDQTMSSSTSVMFHPNTTSEVRIRVRPAAENTNGFWMNIGQANDTSVNFNNNRMKSTLTIQEIAWN
jgi:hypothetical protein